MKRVILLVLLILFTVPSVMLAAIPNDVTKYILVDYQGTKVYLLDYSSYTGYVYKDGTNLKHAGGTGTPRYATYTDGTVGNWSNIVESGFGAVNIIESSIDIYSDLAKTSLYFDSINDPLPPDRDGDGIPDGQDLYPDDSTNTPPPPDRDGDGIPDDEDDYPDDSTNTPPPSDRDGDGIPDAQDNYPDDSTNTPPAYDETSEAEDNKKSRSLLIMLVGLVLTGLVMGGRLL